MRCPYCDWPETREIEEVRGEGVLTEAIYVCPNCLRSVQHGRWTARSTRRAFLAAARFAWPAIVGTLGLWLLRPYRDSLRALTRPGPS